MHMHIKLMNTFGNWLIKWLLPSSLVWISRIQTWYSVGCLPLCVLQICRVGDAGPSRHFDG